MDTAKSKPLVEPSCLWILGSNAEQAKCAVCRCDYRMNQSSSDLPPSKRWADKQSTHTPNRWIGSIGIDVEAAYSSNDIARTSEKEAFARFLETIGARRPFVGQPIEEDPTFSLTFDDQRRKRIQ